MAALDLDAIKARADQAAEWVRRDPCNADGFLPLSFREHFTHDVPALIAEVGRLRVELATAKAEATRKATEPGS